MQKTTVPRKTTVNNSDAAARSAPHNTSQSGTALPAPPNNCAPNNCAPNNCDGAMNPSRDRRAR